MTVGFHCLHFPSCVNAPIRSYSYWWGNFCRLCSALARKDSLTHGKSFKSSSMPTAAAAQDSTDCDFHRHSHHKHWCRWRGSHAHRCSHRPHHFLRCHLEGFSMPTVCSNTSFPKIEVHYPWMWWRTSWASCFSSFWLVQQMPSWLISWLRYSLLCEILVAG